MSNALSMAKDKPVGRYAKLHVIIADEVVVESDQARARLRASGVKVSQSAVVEVALRELLRRRDLADVLRRHGARARRQ